MYSEHIADALAKERAATFPADAARHRSTTGPAPDAMPRLSSYPVPSR